MTKIRFNRLLSVVLALVMLATMMSFVFTANAATTEAKKPINVNNWTDLGLVDAVPNAYETTVTQNATNIYGQASTAFSSYAINACKVFDLSGGFTFTWSMGDEGWNDKNSGDETSRAYNAISIGGITVASQRSGLGDGLGKVYVVKNEAKAEDNSNRVISALWWERNAQVSVFGQVLDSKTGLAGANNVKAYSLTVSADGKLSLAVAGTTICSDIDVSDVDFSDATFSFKSGISYSGGSKYTNPSLTYYKTVQLVDKSVSTWTGLGLVNAAPDANGTTVTQNATTIYGAKGPWYADYAINASEEFDLSNGFTFSWSGNYQWNHVDGSYHAVSIGNLTIAAKCVSGGTNRLYRVYVIHNNNSDSLVLSPKGSGRNGVTGVYGTTLKTVDIDSTKMALNFTVTVSGGKLSLTVGDSTRLSVSADNVDVSDIDFSAVTFGLKSIIGNAIDWYKFTNPSLTYKKAVKLVDNSVNTLTGLDLTSANLSLGGKYVTPSFSADDKTISVSSYNDATYTVNGNKTFDLSCGFTFNWDMGDNGGNSKDYIGDKFLNKLSIGDLTIKSQRNNDNGSTSTITVYNGSTVIATNASVPNSNKVKNYSMTVADGRLTLSVTYNNETTVVFGGDTAVDVRAIDFSAAKFTAVSYTAWSGGFQFKINQLTYKTEVPDRNNFVVTKDGQGFVKCNGKNWIDHDVDAGTQVILTAEAAYGYTFQGWVNGVNNTVVSTEAKLTVRANTTNNYTAVFVKNSGKYTVTVLNLFGKVVGTPASVAAGDKYTLPAAVDVTGYEFKGWEVKDSEDNTQYAVGAEYTVNGNVIFVPVYDAVATPTIYNISVTGGSADKTNVNYNELVTVTATVDNFGYWTKNGVVVSYSSTYSFYAGLANGTDINLVAVADTASAAPVTSIVNVYGSTAKVTFLMERSVPDGYSLVESGFILAKADFGTTDYMSAVDGTTVIKVAASNTSANGQYMLNVKTTSGNAIYAVSYVTYVDASGKLHTVYSTAASATAQ